MQITIIRTRMKASGKLSIWALSCQRKFGRNFRVTDSREEMRFESEINQMMSIRKWNQSDVMSIRKWKQSDVMSSRKWKQSEKATCEKRRLRWVFVGIRGYPLVLVVKSLATHRVILLLRLNSLGFRGSPRWEKPLPKSGGCVGFSWVSGSIRWFWWSNLLQITGWSYFCVSTWVSGGIRLACGQITCKWQGILPLGSQFLGFSLVSGGIRSSWHKVAKASFEKRRLRWVFVGIRGYPLVLVVKSLANHRVILL